MTANLEKCAAASLIERGREKSAAASLVERGR